MADYQIEYYKPDPEVVDHLTRALQCHPLLSALLSARGITSAQEARFFLDPDFRQITDPFMIRGMVKAAERLYTAVINREKILIFGDFDADGVTATALLSDFFEYCDASVSWYIPHRLKEGYSLQTEHIVMAVDREIDLIITVDCGIGSHAAVKAAAKEDIDVIITDHHEPEADLPQAVAVIDPKRNDCPSNLDYLAGVGVAFYLVMALRKHFRDKGFWEKKEEPNLSRYLDLFAIGTIGDMVPLINENRSLCIAGLKKIRQGFRLGIKTLAHTSRVDLQKLDSDDISFKIVPRINAAGRISHARICVTQLTSPDIITAEKTAGLLDHLNQKRQKIEQEIVATIENKIAKTPQLIKKKILILWDSSWDPSVLGIAASKLSRKYGLPVVLLARKEDLAVGSCRSINNINIHKALKAHEDLLIKFGGHAMASGLTLENKNLDILATALNTYMENTYSSRHFEKTILIDAVLDFKDINYALASEIDRMRPFGVSNPEPVFMVHNAHVKSSYIIGGIHRKMILGGHHAQSSEFVEAFQFNVKDIDHLPDYFKTLAFKLKINKYKHQSAQMLIEDFNL